MANSYWNDHPSLWFFMLCNDNIKDVKYHHITWAFDVLALLFNKGKDPTWNEDIERGKISEWLSELLRWYYKQELDIKFLWWYSVEQAKLELMNIWLLLML